MKQYETKRDVMRKAAMNLAEIDVQESNAYAVEGDAGALMFKMQEDKWIQKYDDALPDNAATLPYIVGEILKTMKDSKCDLMWALNEANIRRRDFGDKTCQWILENQDEFARAWIDGKWIVEGQVATKGEY